MYDIIVIGAGPAGLTAALYGRRANKKVLVLEAKVYGGQIVNTNRIDNYPAMPGVSGFDFANNLYNQVIDMGAEVKFEKVIKIDLSIGKKVITDNNEYLGRSIILATGADKRTIGLENEERLTGRGISYCATCDGNFFKDMDVAVYGGGDTALFDAMYLSDICKKVYLIHRRDTFKAEEQEVEEVKQKPNVEFIYNSNVVKLNTTNNLLSSIEVKNNDGNLREIEVSGIFIAVGRVPENQNFAKLINLDKLGYVIAGEDCHTNVEGIFVAGDNRVKKLRQLVTAASDGAIAATEAIRYIGKQE